MLLILIVNLVQMIVYWQKFSIMKTSSDGHCLVYSIINSLKKQHNQNYDYHYVLDQIRNEAVGNISSYMQLLDIDCVLTYHRLLCAYVDGKNYDTVLGDCVPMILTNALNINIVIINRSVDSVDPIIVVPRISSSQFVYIYKHGDHYEGIETNTCFGPLVGIQKPSMSKAYLGTNQAETNAKLVSSSVGVAARSMTLSEGEGTHCSLKPNIHYNILLLRCHCLDGERSGGGGSPPRQVQ